MQGIPCRRQVIIESGRRLDLAAAVAHENHIM